MKTVRSQVFETNSSSTHAVTLCVSHARKPAMRPYSYDNEPITIGVRSYNSWEDEGWTTKMQFLALYLKPLGRLDELEKCRKMVEDFAGFEINFDQESLDKIKTPTDGTQISDSMSSDLEDEYLSDYFSYFISEYHGHDSIADFREHVENLLSNDATILAFVCSTGWFDVEGYYDG